MGFQVTGFEHTHKHSCFSLLDGVSLISEMSAYAKAINQQYLVVTDHGSLSAVPEMITQAEKHKLNPVFGCEIYFNPLQPEVKSGEKMKQYLDVMAEEDRKRQRKSYHFTLLAYNEIGYKNLVRMTSFGYLHGFYYKPRVNWDKFIEHKDGLILLSGCYNSPIGQTFDEYGSDRALDEINKYHSIFGDNFYLEIMLLDFSKQKPYNKFLIKAHEKLGIPLVLTQDCHVCRKEDILLQRLVLAVGSKYTIQELNELEKEGKKDIFEIQDPNLWMKSEEELNEKWESDPYIDKDLFEQAKANSVKICEKCKGVQLDRSVKLPKFPDEDNKLRDLVNEGIKKRAMPQTKEYWSRIREEFALVKEKEFSSYFLIQKMMTDAARAKCRELYGGTGSEAVGPGRGSGSGFLLNYLLGITDVDPVKHDLLSSRFLSPARGGKQMLIRFQGKPS